MSAPPFRVFVIGDGGEDAPLCIGVRNARGDLCLESCEGERPYCPMHSAHDGIPHEGRSVCEDCDGNGCGFCGGMGEVDSISFDGGQNWEPLPRELYLSEDDFDRAIEREAQS